MSDNIFEVKSQKCLRAIWTVNGMAEIIEALKKTNSTLPGAVLSLAIAEKICAEERIAMAAEIYREVAKQGHDLAKSAGVFTTVKAGKVHIEFKPADLVDQSEDEQ